MLTAVVGCGRIGFDATSDATRGDVTGDAEVATGQFSPPSLITPLASTDPDEEPSFTTDRLELVFRSGPLNNPDLFVSRRVSVTDPWGAPTPITELNTPQDDVTPGISGDGLTLWFGSSRSGNSDIWVATRPDRTSPWSAPITVATLNSSAGESAPSVDSNGMWFTRLVGADYEVWHASGTAPTSWSGLAQVTELNSAMGSDGGVRTWAGGTRIVFGTTRTTTTTYDLWEASRTSLAEPFSNLAPISELNTSANDWDFWISEDGHYAVFGSNRSGNHELYETFR